jgi:hypothetical protein
METIKNKIKENRPNLSESSIKTYSSILVNLYKKIFFENINIKNFNNFKKIIEYINTIPISTRKTILSALYVLTKDERYRKDMLEDINEYNEEILKQEKTETQKNNWISQEEINNKLVELEKQSKMAYKHIMLNDKQQQYYKAIQDYIILSLLSGKYINPRRSKDYTEFKIKNIDFTKDNYIKGSKLYFNTYKGSESKGLQIIDIPNELKKIITKWISINPTDYLIFDNKQNKMSNVKLTQHLNKLFDKKVSINALRHTYLTDKHKDTLKKMDELKNDMKMMGSSILQAKTYIKN